MDKGKVREWEENIWLITGTIVCLSGVLWRGHNWMLIGAGVLIIGLWLILFTDKEENYAE